MRVFSEGIKEVGDYSYKLIRSGQPRPYADREKVIEVYLEEGLTRQQASDKVKSMNIGFDDSKDNEWYEPRLSYFKDKGKGVWEFNMITAYTG